MQQVAYNNSEFTYINPSLSCVRWWLDMKRITDSIDNLTKEIEQLKQSPEMLIEELYNWVLKRTKELTTEADISEPLDAIRRTLKKGGTMSASAKIAAQQFLYALILPFCEFDEKAFSEEFRAAYPSTGISNTIKQKEAAREKFMKQKDQHTTKAKEHVGAGAYTSPDTVINKFIGTWKSRVTSYDVPVTIDGVAIHTLPVTTRKIYSDAYTALGFDKLKKTLPRLAHKNGGSSKVVSSLISTPPNAPA